MHRAFLAIGVMVMVAACGPDSGSALPGPPPNEQPDAGVSPPDDAKPDAPETFPLATLRSLSLPANQLVVDPGRHIIYASVPSRAGGPFGGSVVTIDPSLGEV